MTRLRSILLGGTAVAGVVLGVTAWLVLQAIEGAADREATQHGLLAEELFDTLEGELSDLVAREEQRSFLAYRDDASDLASAWGEERDDLVGYFQVGHDGIALPLDMAEELASAVAQLSLPEAPPAPAPPPPKPVIAPSTTAKTIQSAKVQAQVKSNPLGSLKRGAVKRTGRVEQQAKIDAWSAAEFNNYATIEPSLPSGDGTSSGAPPEDVQTRGLSRSTLRPPDVPAPRPVPRPVPPREIDVRISPMESHDANPHLVLYRNVTVDTLTTRQGLVLRTPELAQHLESTVLGSSALRQHVTLAWNSAPPRDAPHIFTHRFAPPFESLAVRASLDRIPEASNNEDQLLVGLALLVLVVVVTGGAGLFRAVRAEVELAQRRSDFASAVTHELKTPLTTIRMYAEMLRDGMVPGPGRQQEYHATIVGESERLTRLVGNVLTLSRLERGSDTPVLQPVQVAPLVHEVAELVRPVLARTGATLDVQLEPDLPAVLADRDGLIHALANLVDNAVKFAAKASDQRVHLTARGDGGSVLFSVRDHGPGVPPQQLKRIFEPFYRGEREITRTTQGTGIGLALVKGTVTQAKGRVTAQLAEGGGLEVSVLLNATGQARAGSRPLPS
ncbi:MAG: HAMP domain-containing histidine kinase [Myxococcales bacterium]|nr:HAMP domain-containing histidine kinase [Myxococcales bacterium]